MLSVRLDEDMERHLNTVCRRYGYSKSEAVKRSLADWLADRLESPPNAHELGADLFDQGGRQNRLQTHCADRYGNG